MKTNQILLCLTLALTVSYVMTVPIEDRPVKEVNQVENQSEDYYENGGRTANGIELDGTGGGENIDQAIQDGLDFDQMRVTRAYANHLGQTFGHIYGVKVEGSTVKGQHPIAKAAVSTQMAAIYLKLWLTFNNNAVSKGPMWANLDTAEDPYIRTCDESRINCDFKNNWNNINDDLHHFFQGTVDHTDAGNCKGDKKKNLYKVQQVIKLNKVFITLRARGRMIRGTRRDKSDKKDARNWPVLLTDENDDSEIDRFDSFGTLHTDHVYGTANDNAYVKKGGNYTLINNKWWRETKNPDYKIGQFYGAKCICPNKHKYNVGLLARDGDLPQTEEELILASRPTCINGRIERNSAIAATDTGEGTTFSGKSVECASSGWTIDRYKILEGCKATNTEPADVDACLDDHLEKYYKNNSSSRWHLDYQEWLIFKKFADKSHHALGPCEYMLLRATRQLPDKCEAGF